MEEITINNKGRYCFRMRGSIMDKCFWVDKVPGTKTVVDWGCADGSMLFCAYHLNPDAGVHYIGYDRDPEMIGMARKAWNGPESINEKTFKKVENADEIMEFHPNLTDLYSTMLHTIGGETCLVLSSVLHEILSEENDPSSREDLAAFVKDEEPKYIAIRDMQFTVSDPQRLDVDPDITENAWVRNPSMASDFVGRYGKLWNLKSLVHFLLKRRYPDNWEHEMQEDYFAAKQPVINAMFPDYEPIYWNRYLPPFLRDEIEKKDGLCMDGITTHVQLILRHRRYSETLRKGWMV